MSGPDPLTIDGLEACHHESGHAVVACAFGVHVDSVSISRDGSGATWLPRDQFLKLPANRALAIDLAGSIAQAQFRREAWSIERVEEFGGSADWRAARLGLLTRGLSMRRGSSLVAAAARQARLILMQKSAAVREVATLLAVYGRIPGTAVTSAWFGIAVPRASLDPFH